MRFAWRETLLFLVGLGVGYTVAVTTRAGTVPFMDPVRAYVATHQIESFVGLILVGTIVYLAGGSGRSGGRR
jgi:hypothetical protein